MEFVASPLDESCIIEIGGRMGHRSHNNNHEYKSKNLHAERRRRQKLSERLLTLRALVPNITNMNKATIVEDSITYIHELQKTVNILKDQLFDMEVSEEEAPEQKKEEIQAAEEMKKFGIQAGVNVTQIDGNKLWVKAILEKKRGGFTKLMEAMTAFGFELTDTSVTTSNGAMLVSSCIMGFYCETLEVEQTKELMQEIINSI
ncbi:transcription factor DYT1-like [Prunus avium]|uniref:Transcription factor DYT1-like n=1 Tax=Prunus avium TaxID=42229 RepID=A0A6P5S1B4_PRUAV|nr:transcription factor DYT1-like [Prunus avium]